MKVLPILIAVFLWGIIGCHGQALQSANGFRVVREVGSYSDVWSLEIDFKKADSPVFFSTGLTHHYVEEWRGKGPFENIVEEGVKTFISEDAVDTIPILIYTRNVEDTLSRKHLIGIPISVGVQSSRDNQIKYSAQLQFTPMMMLASQQTTREYRITYAELQQSTQQTTHRDMIEYHFDEDSFKRTKGKAPSQVRLDTKIPLRLEFNPVVFNNTLDRMNIVLQLVPAMTLDFISGSTVQAELDWRIGTGISYLL